MGTPVRYGYVPKDEAEKKALYEAGRYGLRVPPVTTARFAKCYSHYETVPVERKLFNLGNAITYAALTAAEGGPYGSR